MERLVKFEVLGQEYPLHTDAPEDEVQEILKLVKSQLESCSNRKSLMSAKLAVLVCLNMAGKYVKLKKDFELYKSHSDLKVSELVEKIEGALR